MQTKQQLVEDFELTSLTIKCTDKRTVLKRSPLNDHRGDRQFASLLLNTVCDICMHEGMLTWERHMHVENQLSFCTSTGCH